MASETTAATNTIRQNEHPYLKKRRKCIVLFIYFLIKKIISEIVPLWLKNQNQRVDTGGAYARRRLYEGGLIRGVTQVSRNRWAYLRRGLYAGGGLIGGEIRYYRLIVFIAFFFTS